MSAKKKHVGSTAGMQTSVKTSELLTHRAEKIVPRRMTEMRRAILDRDFQTFADITMKVHMASNHVASDRTIISVILEVLKCY